MEQSIFKPTVVQIVAGLGLAWSLFGVVQFSRQFSATPDMLMHQGMTPAQAALYASLPAWMTMAFAVGVFGGVAGSLLLLFGRRAAIVVLGLSLIGYAILFVGDMVEGVFAIFGVAQVAILSLVIAIAMGLLGASVLADRRQWLR